MASWLGRKESGEKGKKGGEEEKRVVLDGTEIRELVENKEAFTTFVEHKFQELDVNHDGKLSVKELQPAVADIGVALGLPAQGSSPDSDHIYSEVLNEFTHGKQEQVSKSEFKEVLSDILLGMAAGLKRDPIIILRIDGEDVKEFVESPKFEPEALSIFSQMESANESLRKCLTVGLQQLTVEHGMPPASDSWLLDLVWRDLPKDQHQKTPKDYLRVALDRMASSADLPPYGAVDQVDAVVNEAFKMVNADDGKIVDEAEFKKTLTEILGSVMLQLEGNPVSISSNSVVHEPLESSSTLLPPLSLQTSQSEGD
ncbi:uncharacterized protein [Elaeis guineensis]|uniref:Uncharacterized protein LOC105044153 isoform X3 n=1 Tax=Elaeis guineensis var. tenera TaxID=51953 RepID=A0A6I9R4E3_ELAGV|nr:uncharacterized protein LOC105044153 isoform X3 [Elaeis guineensis]